MTYVYPVSRDVIEKETLRILKSANTGKDWRNPPRPKELNSYQIAGRFQEEIARPIIEKCGFGGRNGSKGNELTLTQEVMHACKRLAKLGLVKIHYQDCDGLMVSSPLVPDPVIPSYGVCGTYEYVGPL
jgi:hypothetical protein